MMRNVFRSFVFCAAAAACCGSLAAQSGRAASHEVDLAVTYNGLRGQTIGGSSFWSQGGSVDLSAEAYHGLGVALVVAGNNATNLAGSGIRLTTISTLVGPRYTFRKRRMAFFAEGLAGEANALNSIFPSSGGAITSTNNFAAQAGGGVDLTISRRFAIRAVQASWLRTQFPNSTTNVQNSLQVGAGIVFRLQR